MGPRRTSKEGSAGPTKMRRAGPGDWGCIRPAGRYYRPCRSKPTHVAEEGDGVGPLLVAKRRVDSGRQLNPQLLALLCPLSIHNSLAVLDSSRGRQGALERGKLS